MKRLSLTHEMFTYNDSERSGLCLKGYAKAVIKIVLVLSSWVSDPTCFFDDDALAPRKRLHRPRGCFHEFPLNLLLLAYHISASGEDMSIKNNHLVTWYIRMRMVYRNANRIEEIEVELTMIFSCIHSQEGVLREWYFEILLLFIWHH